MAFSYWSADIIWAVQLPMDLHVDGTVTINAYVSSTFGISGFFSGSGYGMGLVDIDQNDNMVQQFITQAPYTQSGNAFTSTPSLYSVSTSVDYTFKAGHSIGFALGLGATSQGFSATVYFDSASYCSGATLPVIDASQSQSFAAGSQNVGILSDSAISNFQYSSSSNSLKFNAQGINYTQGYCNVSIPKALMQQPFTVTSGSQQITSTLSQNSTHYQVYFSHTVNTNPIQIVGTSVNPPTATPTAKPSATPTSTATSSSGTTASPTTTESPTSTDETSPTATTPASTTSATGSPVSTGTSEATTSSQGSMSPTATPKPDHSLSVPEYSFLAFLAVLVATAMFAVWRKKSC